MLTQGQQHLDWEITMSPHNDELDLDPDDPDGLLNEPDPDDEPCCPRCNGPIYSQPHWSYFRCDDCGYTEKKAEMEP